MEIVYGGYFSLKKKKKYRKKRLSYGLHDLENVYDQECQGNILAGVGEIRNPI